MKWMRRCGAFLWLGLFACSCRSATTEPPPATPGPRWEIAVDRDAGVQAGLDRMHAVYREAGALRDKVVKLEQICTETGHPYGMRADDRATSILRNGYGEVVDKLVLDEAAAIRESARPREQKLAALDELQQYAAGLPGLARGVASSIAMELAFVKAAILNQPDTVAR